MNIDTHVILISAQAVPNITPLLDEQFKPKNVIMLVSPDMRQRADWLEAVIKTKGIKSQRWDISNAWDIEHIRDNVIDLLNQHEGKSMALNATGGTKPMSIAAYDVFRAFELPIFYVHPDHDRVIWMHPPDRPSHDLADRIRLPEFFSAYGATVTETGDKLGVPAADRELTQTLISEVQRWAAPLSILNAYAAEAQKNLTATLRPKDKGYSELRHLIALFEHNGLLAVKGDTLQFANEDNRFYVNGGWLEQHVYGLCLNLKKAHGIQDIDRSLQVERSHRNPSVKNELDVVFLKDNRLYIIECKTHSDKNQVGGKNADAIYKLDSLKDLLGGLQARAMLVSFNRPNQYDLQRANDLGIAVCAHQDLLLLPQKLTQWIV